MMTVKYTDHSLLQAIGRTSLVSRSRTVSGYGGMIATVHMIQYAGRWHRVYAMQYGNAASVYIRTKDGNLFLDSDTEFEIQGY